MNEAQKMVLEFHKAFKVPFKHIPDAAMPNERQQLRYDLIKEELIELILSMAERNLIGIADGLADLLYVVYGTAVEYGIDIDAVFKEVHRSNMSKLGADGQSILRQDGKVLKGPNYSPPDIKTVLDRQFPE